MSGKEALNKLVEKDIEKMLHLNIGDRREKLVCECIMIMVFYEKDVYTYSHFQAKVTYGK